MTEKDKIQEKLIQSTTGCTIEEAELAWAASEGDEEKALQIVGKIQDKYLALKIYFSGSGMKSIEGLIVAILQEGAEAPLYSASVVSSYAEEPLQVDNTASVIYWQQLITASKSEQNRFNIESSIELQDYIRAGLTPEPFHTLMKATREIKKLELSELSEIIKDKKIKEQQHLINITTSDFVENALAQPLKVDTGTELLNEHIFEEIAQTLGIITQNDAAAREGDPGEVEEKKGIAKVVFVKLKGKLILDVSQGILAKDLKLKDKIAVDVTERTRLAENVGRLLGLRSQGHWLHAWGLIAEIDELTDGRRRIVVEIAKNVFVDTITMGNIKIKSTRKYPGGNRHEYILETPSIIPSYFMVAGMVLFFSLLVKIFMVMANR